MGPKEKKKKKYDATGENGRYTLMEFIEKIRRGKVKKKYKK